MFVKSMHQIARIEFTELQNFPTQGGSAPLQPPPGGAVPWTPATGLEDK